LKSKLEYAETLWGLVRTLATKPPDTATAGDSGTSMTRREANEAGAGTG
jgi:hypothetical protein